MLPQLAKAIMALLADLGKLSRAPGRASTMAMSLRIVLILAVAATPSGQAQTFTVLHQFTGKRDGSNAQVGLVQDVLYGTTFLGGDQRYRCGTVFKLFPNGDFNVLHEFVGTDGANPSAGLVMDKEGNLYGTTSQGGGKPTDAGTVFKLAPPTTKGGPWTESVLHIFTGGADGAHPYAGLIQDSAGYLYGTTNRGGTFNNGTVFKVDKAGNETVLYSFGSSPDGAYPYAGLVRDNSGNFYGTTFDGGNVNYGTVFKLDATGTETVLHSFAAGSDGAYPNAALTLDAHGNLFGTTDEGGDASSDGMVFRIDNTGAFSVFYTFLGNGNGASPEASVVFDAAGNLYSSTNEGGDHDYYGTVFEMDATGKKAQLHVFGGADGAYPYSGALRDADGNLWGTTITGGIYDQGVAFKIIPWL